MADEKNGICITVICLLILGLAALTTAYFINKTDDEAVVEMVKAGADPVKASCAVKLPMKGAKSLVCIK